MAPHSSTLGWKIPWMEETGRLQSMGLLRVGHDWATSLWLLTFMHWRRKWQPTPVFLPGIFPWTEEYSHGQVGYSPWGHKRIRHDLVTKQHIYMRASLVAQLVKNLSAVRETLLRSWVGKMPWRREWLPTPVFLPREFHGLYSPWSYKQ